MRRTDRFFFHHNSSRFTLLPRKSRSRHHSKRAACVLRNDDLHSQIFEEAAITVPFITVAHYPNVQRCGTNTTARVSPKTESICKS